MIANRESEQLPGGADILVCLFCLLSFNENSSGVSVGNGIDLEQKTQPLKRPRRNNSSTRFAFTLIEMLLATVLASILMAGVLVATAALSRDRLRMEARQSAAHSPAALDLIRKDLASAIAFIGAPNPGGFEILSYSGVDAKSLLPNQRLARVKYRIIREGRTGVLVRDQAYLDDPVRIDHWSDAVALNVLRINITPLSNDAETVHLGEDVEQRLLAIDRGKSIPLTARMPSRVRVRIEYQTGVVDQDMVLR
jgi:prepilin-type N-terminal cleavage/methylation domain-containing protein